MPKFAIHAAALDSLVTQGLADDELGEYFRRHPNAPDIDAWLLSPLRRGTLAGQRLLRIARHAVSHKTQLDGSEQILFGMPLVTFNSVPDSLDWAPAHRELEAGLAHAWDLPVRLCARPVPVSALHAEGATRFARWAAALAGSLSGAPDPSDSLQASSGAGPWVWVGLVTAPTMSPWLENLFFRTTAEASRAFRTLGFRIDAILEEQALQAQALPPTGVWNALSVGRIGAIRATLQRLPRTAHTELQESPEGVAVFVDGVEALSVPMPEETRQDLAPLLQWHSQRSSKA